MCLAPSNRSKAVDTELFVFRVWIANSILLIYFMFRCKYKFTDHCFEKVTVPVE